VTGTHPPPTPIAASAAAAAASGVTRGAEGQLPPGAAGEGRGQNSILLSHPMQKYLV